MNFEKLIFPRSRYTILIVLLVPCFLIIGAAVIADRAERNLATSFGWVSHTHEVERRVERLLALLVDVETGQRGFLLTGQDAYLEPYSTALAELPREVAALQALTADNPVQQHNLLLLDPMIAAKLDFAAQSIALQQNGKREAALALIQTGRGLETMAPLRALLRSMEEEEQQLLVTRQQRLESKAQFSRWNMFFLVALNVLFAVTVFLLYRRLFKLQALVTVCAWSRTVEFQGEWLSFEKYLIRRFGLNTSHGISPAEAEKVFGPLADLSKEV